MKDYYGKVNIDEMVLFPARLKTLYGKPNKQSLNNEDWFKYFFEIDGKPFIVYGNSADTHIGGESNEDSLQIAKKFLSYALDADPTDYEWTSYYMDTATKVTMGVTNGNPYLK